jgi:hypothetical protein
MCRLYVSLPSPIESILAEYEEGHSNMQTRLGL